VRERGYERNRVESERGRGEDARVFLRREDRGRRNEGQQCRSAGNFTTYFFSNFPESHGQLDMFKIFQKWTRMKKVFISRRRNKWGWRFGFVRFDVSNTTRLERELDQMFIGNLKLHVKLLRYSRTTPEVVSGIPREAREVRRLYHPKSAFKKMEEVRRDKPGKEVWKPNNRKHSYAEVVKSSPQDKWKGPSFESKWCISPWMEKKYGWSYGSGCYF